MHNISSLLIWIFLSCNIMLYICIEISRETSRVISFLSFFLFIILVSDLALPFMIVRAMEGTLEY